MTAYIWTGVALAILAILVAAWSYDRRMRAQGRSVRSSSEMIRDGRDAKSDARAFRGRLGSPTTAADFAVKGRKERDARRAGPGGTT